MKHILLTIIVVVMLSGLVLAQTKHQEDKTEAVTQAVSPRPPKEVSGAFNLMLSALETSDYQSAVMPLNDAMKMSFTKPLFDRLSARFSPRLKQGYEAVYLGELNKRSFRVHLWKLTFQDGGVDVLAELSIKENKVDGFHLRG